MERPARVTRVGSKYVFEYRHFVYLNWKSQKCMYFIFGWYLKMFANTTKYTYPLGTFLTGKRQSIAWHSLTSLIVKTECPSPTGRVSSGQTALKELAHSEAVDQTLASMNEWEASEAYHHP